MDSRFAMEATRTIPRKREKDQLLKEGVGPFEMKLVAKESGGGDSPST